MINKIAGSACRSGCESVHFIELSERVRECARRVSERARGGGRNLHCRASSQKALSTDRRSAMLQKEKLRRTRARVRRRVC